jgi:AcrR family transcriptional regulator
MPKLKDASREARRAQIAQAALRCFGRDGVERTTIAAVSAEAGLSAGSIYVHYKNKADLVQTVTLEVLQRRVESLSAVAGQDVPPGPDELMALMMGAVSREEAGFGLQVWGEATTDTALRDVFLNMYEQLSSLIEKCCLAWLTKVQGLEAGSATREAGALAAHLMTLYQGRLVRIALLDDPSELPQLTTTWWTSRAPAPPDGPQPHTA